MKKIFVSEYAKELTLLQQVSYVVHQTLWKFVKYLKKKDVLNITGMTEKDEKDIRFGVREGADFIAASFVRRASDVMEIRQVLEEEGRPNVKISSKIENQEGVDNLDEILEVSDGIMVARGDLGVEIPTPEVPIVQKHIIKKCNEAGKVVITATQMLDSM